MSVSELEALPGLTAAKRTLRGVFSHQASVHAILLYGDEGAGKAKLARFLAGYWLCLNPGAEGPCGECKACVSFAKDRCSDMLPVRPAGASNLIRRAHIHPMPDVEIDGEPVLSVQEFLRTRPIQARSKVVMMEGAERMNADAANAFLKSLEEPQDYGRFVLTTTEIGRVLPTIRSRCMPVPCELPTQSEWEAAYSPSEPWEAIVSRRSPGTVERIRRHADIYRDVVDLAHELRTLPQGAALVAAERFRKLVERLQKAEETNARGAGTAALRALGNVLARDPRRVKSVQRIAASHRRILGNANPALEFDALFAELLADNGSA